MAVISGLERTYGVSTRIREAVDEAITMLDPIEHPLFTLLNRKPIFNTTVEWIYENLRGFKTALTELMASDASDATTTATITAGEGTTKFHTTSASAPAFIRIDEEILKVVANAANLLTCIRGYGGSTTAEHADDSAVYILGEAELEGSDAAEALVQAPTRPNNITQIFTDTVHVSGTAQAVEQYGIGRGEVDFQIRQRMIELGIKVENAILNGVKGTTTHSASVHRTMNGLFAFVDTANVTNNSGVALSQDNVEADLKKVFDAGGLPSVIMTNSTQNLKIQRMYESRIRTEVVDNVGGLYINQIMNPVGGGIVMLLVNRRMADHEVYYLDTRFVDLGELRPFHVKPLAESGDYTKVELIGEYTLRVKAPKAFARRYNCSTS